MLMKQNANNDVTKDSPIKCVINKGITEDAVRVNRAFSKYMLRN